ncbi:MFS transporter [Streptomyces sp. NBC_01433]|uniref:MFS transporter n=1 Tax=Streptomyces sp. NBC_01433 TaxID=2903864 RepID=UPI00225BF5C5|nr:MFS transporter [Streptomyces sp. NBC_01433]MCX4681626.1 MFS transporter [Streptomyces sp. NBC_01433]
MARDNRTVQSYPAPLRVPAAYWMLVAGFTICRSGCVVVPFLSLYLVRQQHFSAADAAQVSAAFGAGWAIGPAVAGWLADHVGRRPTLLVALTAVAAMYLTLPALQTLIALTAAALAVGLLFDAPRPAVLALVADLVPEQARGRAYARLYWASNIGAGVAGAVGTALADNHITALFYIAATSNLAFAATVLICKIGAGPAAKTHHGRAASSATGYRALLHDGRFLALCGFTLLYLCSYQQVLFGLPVAMDRDGLNPSAYGIISLINAIGVVAFQPLLQPWIDRRTPLVVCAAGAITLGLGMGGNLGAQQTLVGYGLAAAAWTLGEVLFFSSVMTVVERLAPDDARGRYTGIWASTMGISALIAPLISSVALHAGGPELMWTTCLALGVLAAVGLLALKRNTDITFTPTTPDPADLDLAPTRA